MFREFQKLQENRRKISSLTKPLIRKLRGSPVWVCQLRALPDTKGFGNTPAEAYRDWKYWKSQC